MYYFNYKKESFGHTRFPPDSNDIAANRGVSEDCTGQVSSDLENNIITVPNIYKKYPLIY